MLFNSNIFLFIYLPIVLAGFYVLRSQTTVRWAMAWLAASSLFFYGYWDLRFLPLLLLSILTNYTLSHFLRPGESRALFIAAISFNLLLLAFFKYANFFVDNVAEITGVAVPLRQIVLPIGISFFTFTQIAFLVDRWRGNTAQPGLVNYGLFVTFFPHLIAGPILHHREMMGQFETMQARSRWDISAFNTGLCLLAIGLIKKVVIADSLGSFASPLFDRAAGGETLEAILAWSAALGYHLQIYFDFSAYCEMAMGLALMFGIRFPVNFDSPYQARSIIDFWRRWHMTLSRFLRDYLYIPLGGSRSGPVRRMVNLMIVMLLGGLWHGAAWTFVLWGGLHGLYLMINHGWNRLGLRLPWPWLGLLLTNLAVIIAWVTFRADNLPTALSIYRSMAFLNGTALPLEARYVLEILGLSPDQMNYFAENSRTAFYIGLAWIAGAGVLALFGRSTLRLFPGQSIATDQAELERRWKARDQEKAAPDRVFGGLRGLTASTGAAVAIGLMLFWSIRVINSAPHSEFLYFQF